MTDPREHLTGFIQSVIQRMADGHQVSMLRLGATQSLSISFGNQYAQPGEVIVWRPDDSFVATTPEKAVDEFIRFYDLE